MQRFIDHWNRHQQLRYLLTGAWNTAAGYAIFVVLYFLLAPKLDYRVIAVATHIVAVTQSFVTQRRLVFRSRKNWLGEYGRFHIAHLFTLGLGLVLLSLLVETFEISPLLAQAIVTTAVVMISYFVHQNFTFRTNKDV